MVVLHGLIIRSDGKTHIVYNSYLEGHIRHRSYNGSWGSETEIGDQTYIIFTPLSSSAVSNDLFVVWLNTSTNKVHYRQYDAVPLAPANLTIGSENNHPKLQWTKNNEPDVTKYYIYRNPGSGYQYLGQTTSNFYVDETLEYCALPPPAQCNDENTYFYRITAVDLGSNESSPSNSVRATLVGGGPPQKAGSNLPGESIDYSLSYNYPNPFNPSTTISYSIPEDAIVTIKIYDMLGTEVAELVNEAKPAGYYEAVFDASDLSSGVYVYRITALRGDRILFSDSNRMMLVK